MPTTSICDTVRGNRRSDNIPEGVGGSAEGNTPERRMASEPQISSQGLQFAGFAPIKPLPSIKEMTAQTQVIVQQVQAPQPATVETVPQLETEETQNLASPQPATVETELQPETVETQNIASPQPTSADTESFEDCWKQMVDAIFQKKPAFYPPHLSVGFGLSGRF